MWQTKAERSTTSRMPPALSLLSVWAPPPPKLPPVQSPFIRTCREMCLFLTHPKPGATVPRGAFHFPEKKIVLRRKRSIWVLLEWNQELWNPPLGRKFQQCWKERWRNDDNEKSSLFPSQNWKRGQFPITFIDSQKYKLSFFSTHSFINKYWLSTGLFQALFLMGSSAWQGDPQQWVEHSQPLKSPPSPQV